MFSKTAVSAAILAATLTSVGCSSGGGGSTPAAPAAPTTLSGTAAAGAPIIGTVTIKGALGNTRSSLIEADGSYTVDVTGLTAPYRLRAQGTVGGRTYKLHSYAVESDVGGIVNITPFTDLILANAAQQIAESYFDSNTPTELTEAEIDAQETALETKLQAVFSAVGMTGAIDLLNASFSANHSGLDAVLDLVTVEVDPILNIATITDFLGNSISDDLTDDTNDDPALTVADQTAYTTAATTAVTDTQAIAALFTTMASAYANGLPTQASIQDLFADDFLHDDYSKGLFLTDITTDPGLIGMMFSGVSVSNLDSTAGTAQVIFTFGANGALEYEPETWYVAKNADQWQFRGNQQIAETYFSYHCNDGDGDQNLAGTSNWAGACGINTQIWDEIFTNNGTIGDAPIASGTVEIIDGTDQTTVKTTVYLGTPAGGTAGDVQVFNESTGQYQWDWKEFGINLGQINPAIFAEGDIIRYSLYTGDLDITTPASPAVDLATFVTSYEDTVLFTPDVTTSKMPSLTSAAITAMSNFTLGSDLTISWTLAAGTRNEEVLFEITDNNGERVEIWDWILGETATSKNFSASVINAAVASQTAFDSNATPLTLKVRIYAADELTGQSHSRDYDVTIGSGGGGGSSLTCNYESGWDDLADGGLGAPITPNSFADYEAVVQDCLGGTPSTFTAADLAGTAYVEGGTETVTFNALGGAAGTEADRGTGTFDDGAGFVVDFQWWVEAASCSGCNHSYVVVYSDSSLDADLPVGFWFRETTAITGVVGTPGVSGAVYTMYRYAEQSNYSDADRANAADGEIWFSSDNVLQ